MMFDMIIRGGTVIDGTGRPGFSADIAVSNGKVAAIGDLASAVAVRSVDASGKLITPGFIDIHRHADAAAFRPGFGEAELRQGLTTIVSGNCGLSVAPFGSENADAIRAYLRPITGEITLDVPTGSLADYFAAQHDLPLHCGMLVGAGILRAGAAGYQLEHMEDRHYTAIHRAMESALADGALGVSLGLGYAPECFYSTEELIRALQPIAGQDIPLTVHMRQEGGGVCDSIREMLYVAKTLHCPLHISHLKAMGKVNWGKKIPEALRLLTDAYESGMDVSCDVYPYTAGSTQLLHILPPDYLTGGLDAVSERLRDSGIRRELAARVESGEGFDNIAGLAGWDGILLTSLHLPEHQIYQGKSLAEIAVMRAQTPLDACCDLLSAEHCQITMIDFMASEDDIAAILQSPLSCLISDATYPTEGQPHPRVYGSCTHLLTRFVLEKGALRMEQAVEKLTSAPAKALRLQGKGVVAAGMDADICVFDPSALKENATYTDPCRCSDGMSLILVGGKPALENGTLTGITAGQIIRR